MSGLACVLWWIVLGALLGLLASWLLGRIFRRPMPAPVERIVEKVIERPVDRVVEKLVEKPVDRIVERVVEKPVETVVERVVERLVETPADNTALLQQIATLSATAALVPTLRSRLAQALAAPPATEAAPPAEPPIKPATEPAIDLAAAKAAGFSLKGADDLELVEGIGPKIAGLLRAKGILSFAQLAETPVSRIRAILDEAGPNYRIADPGTWPEQADLAARNRWSALRALQDVLDAGVRVDGRGMRAEIEDLKRRLSDSQAAAQAAQAAMTARRARPIDLALAAAAGFSLKGPDDLEVIEGIGPKIAELLRKAGIDSFAQLAEATPEQIQPILDAAGPNFKLADPHTWPEQAALCAMNQWAALKALQGVLTAGRR
ncbi:MAG: DUF4332 domain-containing protein [Rubrivivax sp.]|nr:DUF4332 domain-containing protein [Rubrivivax sp.]